MTRQKHFRPLVSSANQLRTSVARVLVCEVLGQLTKTDPATLQNRHWPGDTLAREFYDDMVIRGTTAPADTTTSGWASQLAPAAVGAFLSGLAPMSAAVRLFEKSVRLDFTGVNTFTIPRATTSAEPTFIAELSPIPITQNVLGAVTVGPVKKMLLGSAVSAELEFYAVESAVAIVQSIMSEQAGRSLDSAVFSTAAASSLRPAGLLLNVTPIAGTAGADVVAMVSDLRNLIGAISDAGISGDNVVFICNPRQAIALRALASPTFGYEIFSTTAVAAGTVIGIAPDAIASGYSGLPQISMSEHGLAHFDGTTPLQIGVAGSPPTIAGSVLSAWQANLLLLRLRLNVAWASLVPGTTSGAVAVVTGATW
jgi:hypothetical protein